MLLVGAVSSLASACSSRNAEPDFPQTPQATFSKQDIARMFSAIPMGKVQMDEVFTAVNSSSGNGYDEEYTLRNLFEAPGAGVGATKAAVPEGQVTLRDMLTEYIAGNYGTKSGASDVENYVNELIESGYQVYWPYSENWDGETFPLITFDPGYGIESNYGYEIRIGQNGARVVDSVYVDEAVAMERPVWVINRNSDAGFTPLEMFLTKGNTGAGGNTRGASSGKNLVLKSFTMLRNYDSWFEGASEFYIRCGSLAGCEAASESDFATFSPTVTEFLLVVKRIQLGKQIPVNTMMVTDFTDQIDKIALLITEDDGGTRTSWKCSATLKYKSKTYGFDVELPYNEKDDIVWRGPVSTSYFTENPYTVGRFGDVKITFALE